MKLIILTNPKLIKILGFDEWEKIIKYSFENKKIEFLLSIVEEDKIDDFIEFKNLISEHINDDLAFGVNKFLVIARFFIKQEKFCIDLSKQIKNGKTLSEIEIVTLQNLMYREYDTDELIEVDDLSKIINLEKKDLINKPNKDNLLKFLFNIDYYEAIQILENGINSKTVAQIRSRAKREKNNELLLETDFIGIIVDIIENIIYYYSDNDINKIVEGLQKFDDKTLGSIKNAFGSINELIRKFYEIEARQELLDLDKLKNNTEITKEYPGLKEGSTVKVIDVSNMKHTIYAHVYTCDIPEFFNTTVGLVTISVSVETDKHEEYYGRLTYDNNTIGFTKLPDNSFVGSSPQNMGSYSFITENNYETKLNDIFDEFSIRESYNKEQKRHSETILYRLGLIPTCLIISNFPPTHDQLIEQAQWQEEVRKIPGHENDEIVFVKTQGRQKRTFDYSVKGDDNRSLTQNQIKERERFINNLRNTFFDILNTEKQPNMNTPIYIRSNKYTIINGEVFDVITLSDSEKAAVDIIKKLELIAFKDSPENIVDIREIEEKGKNYFVRKEHTDSRTLVNLTRNSEKFSNEAYSVLLKEFIIDHLMCNYNVGNDAFTLSSDNSIKSSGIKEPLELSSDFVSASGIPYTAMSYYYYFPDENIYDYSNNVYRRIFETYITSEKTDDVITEQAFEDMKKFAEEISEIPDEEYLQMFENFFKVKSPYDQSKKDEMKSIIMARKNNIVKDTNSFIERIKRQRKIAHSLDEIPNPSSVAIITDIHGNAQALETLLNTCVKNKKSNVFILGDMIGFGAESNKCIDLIRSFMSKLNIRCILGNHELYSLMGNKSFDLYGRDDESTREIRKSLTNSNREFLEELPISRKVKIGDKTIEFTHFPIRKGYLEDSRIYMSHGGSYINVDRTESGVDVDYVIYGHEHQTQNTSENEVGTPRIFMKNDVTFINLPSSGCVHGENTSLTYLEEKSVDQNSTKTSFEPIVISIPYDKDKNDEAIRNSNNQFPEFFGTKINRNTVR